MVLQGQCNASRPQACHHFGSVTLSRSIPAIQTGASLHQRKERLRVKEEQHILGEDGCEQEALEKTFSLKKEPLEKIPKGHPAIRIPKPQQTCKTREQMPT